MRTRRLVCSVVGVIALARVAQVRADPDTLRRAALRPAVELGFVRTQTASASADGGAAEAEVTAFGEDDGLDLAIDLALGAGWAAGLDFDARAGVGAAFRTHALAVAAIAGVGADGYGAAQRGDELHTAGGLAYLGGHARVAIGDVLVDVSALTAARTAGAELRFAGALSWQPAGGIGYGLGVSTVAIDGFGRATFLWLGVYPR